MEKRKEKFVDVDRLIPGHLYEVASRNLRCAVWTDKPSSFGPVGCFIGIRRKFGSQLLDSEFPRVRDLDSPFQTVFEVKPLDERLDESISLEETLGDVCQECRKRAWWINPRELEEGEWPWKCEGGCERTYSYAAFNEPLFNALIEAERRHGLYWEERRWPRSLDAD